MIFSSGFDPAFVLAMAQAPSGANPLMGLIPIALVMAIMFFLVVLPARRRQQKVQAFLAALKVGDRVITSGGIYGTITKLEERSLQLQIANNVRVELARNAVVGYQGQKPVSEP